MLTVGQAATDDQIHKTQELFVEYFDFLRTVRPQFRGKKVGRILVERLID